MKNSFFIILFSFLTWSAAAQKDVVIKGKLGYWTDDKEDFGLLEVKVEGVDKLTKVDENGEFRIKGLPYKENYKLLIYYSGELIKQYRYRYEYTLKSKPKSIAMAGYCLYHKKKATNDFKNKSFKVFLQPNSVLSKSDLKKAKKYGFEYESLMIKNFNRYKCYKNYNEWIFTSIHFSNLNYIKEIHKNALGLSSYLNY